MSSITTRTIEALLTAKLVEPGSTRHGLVIGIDRYQDSRLNLRCARADATAMYDIMIDESCGLFPKENVKLLCDEQATTSAVLRAFAELRDRVGPNDVVWIYYAGHAANDADARYWVTHGADIENLIGTAVDRERVEKIIERLQSERVVQFLDCCYAGTERLNKNLKRGNASAELLSRFPGKGVVTIAASTDKEKSVELTDVGHGAFTYYLLRGLAGHADANGDDVVTVDELWTYLGANVQQASQNAGNPQNPQIDGPHTHYFPLTLSKGVTQKVLELRQGLDRLLIDLDELASSRKIPREWHTYCEALVNDWVPPQLREDSIESRRMRVLERYAEGDFKFPTLRSYFDRWQGEGPVSPLPAAQPPPQPPPPSGPPPRQPPRARPPTSSVRPPPSPVPVAPPPVPPPIAPSVPASALGPEPGAAPVRPRPIMTDARVEPPPLEQMVDAKDMIVDSLSPPVRDPIGGWTPHRTRKFAMLASLGLMGLVATIGWCSSNAENGKTGAERPAQIESGSEPTGAQLANAGTPVPSAATTPASIQLPAPTASVATASTTAASPGVSAEGKGAGTEGGTSGHGVSPSPGPGAPAARPTWDQAETAKVQYFVNAANADCIVRRKTGDNNFRSYEYTISSTGTASITPHHGLDQAQPAVFDCIQKHFALKSFGVHKGPYQESSGWFFD